MRVTVHDETRGHHGPQVPSCPATGGRGTPEEPVEESVAGERA